MFIVKKASNDPLEQLLQGHSAEIREKILRALLERNLDEALRDEAEEALRDAINYQKKQSVL